MHSLVEVEIGTHLIFRLKHFLDRGELKRPQKSVNLVTHEMFRNYIHDVTLLIMQMYDDDDDLATLLLFNYYIRKL